MPKKKEQEKNETTQKNWNKYKNQSRGDGLLCLFNTFASFYYSLWIFSLLLCSNSFYSPQYDWLLLQMNRFIHFKTFIIPMMFVNWSTILTTTPLKKKRRPCWSWSLLWSNCVGIVCGGTIIIRSTECQAASSVFEVRKRSGHTFHFIQWIWFARVCSMIWLIENRKQA